MQTPPECDGQITYDLAEFCKNYGHPAGQLFTFEITYNGITYVYANVAGTVSVSKVIFDLNREDLADTWKAH
jgi:hypothetical protein